MIYSQLYSGIRHAIFGAVTAGGMTVSGLAFSASTDLPRANNTSNIETANDIEIANDIIDTKRSSSNNLKTEVESTSFNHSDLEMNHHLTDTPKPFQPANPTQTHSPSIEELSGLKISHTYTKITDNEIEIDDQYKNDEYHVKNTAAIHADNEQALNSQAAHVTDVVLNSELESTHQIITDEQSEKAVASETENPFLKVIKPTDDQKKEELLTKLYESAYKPYTEIDKQPEFVEKVSEKVKQLIKTKKSQPEENKVKSDSVDTNPTPKFNINNQKVNPIGQELKQQLTEGLPLEEEQETVQVPRCYGEWVYPQNKTTHSESLDNSELNHSDIPNTVPEGWFHAIADYGYYDNVRYAELSGNVSVRQGQQLIEAEKVTLDMVNRTAEAHGQVMFSDSPNLIANDTSHTDISNPKSLGIIGVADKITYGENITPEANHIAFASVPMQAHGYAKKLAKTSDDEYNLENVMFTSCSPTERKWHLESKKIDLNTKTGRGETYNTTLHIKDVPIFYLPYFNFPIDSRRTSGFMIPNASLNSETGLEVLIPYYFNLAPNYDATVTTRIFTDRNPMMIGEFRYLTDNLGEGKVLGTYLPKDKRYDDEDRNSLFYRHHWQSNDNPHLTAQIDYNHVSDKDYDDDFDYLGVSDSYLNLPRSAKVNYFNDYIDTELKVEDYQSLDAKDIYGSRITDKDRPYARLPQFTLNYRLPSFSELSTMRSDTGNAWQHQHPYLDKLQISGTHDSAYFKKDIKDGSELEKSGFRMYNKLSASYPYERPWGYIEPKLSLQHLYTAYDEDARIANKLSKTDNSKSVLVPQISIDTMANFEKRGSPFGWFDKGTKNITPNTSSNHTNHIQNNLSHLDHQSLGYQIISPRLKYSYAPFKSQNNIPNFNTRIASINYDQLYSDSWFLGHDRLQDLHALTPGVNYRYIDDMGLTRLDANIAQQFYLDAGQVTLDNTDNQERESLFNENSSGVVTSISAQPYDNVWLDFNGALKDNYDLNYITSQVRYQPTTDSQFTLGVIERKADNNTNQLPISALTASAIFPVNENWRVISQAQYDYDENAFLDAIFGVDYEDCCIGFAVYGRHYYNDLDLNDKPNQAIMAELRLKGLSSGGQLTKLLSNKILGLDNVNNSWKKSPEYRLNTK